VIASVNYLKEKVSRPRSVTEIPHFINDKNVRVEIGFESEHQVGSKAKFIKKCCRCRKARDETVLDRFIGYSDAQMGFSSAIEMPS
jgi:hypothetical protein